MAKKTKTCPACKFPVAICACIPVPDSKLTKKSAKKTKEKWTKIADNRVRHIWVCDKCGSRAEIDPSFYAEAGIPICGSEGEASDCEGDDMSYSHTEVRSDGGGLRVKWIPLA